MDDALQRYKSGNSCQEPPILYISTFPQGIHINNPYKELFFLISVLAIVPPWPGILPFHQAEDTAVSLIHISPRIHGGDEEWSTSCYSDSFLQLDLRCQPCETESRQRNWPPSDTRIKHLLKPHHCLRMPYHLLQTTQPRLPPRRESGPSAKTSS